MANGYQFIGTEVDDNAGVSVASAGDVDGDGLADLIIGAYRADGGGNLSGEAYLATSANLAAADAADGVTDGVIDLDNLAAQSTSYQFIGTEAVDIAGYSVASAGDVDGDGLADLIIGAQLAAGGGSNSGEAYLATAANLAAADAADGVTDGVINLDNLAAQSTSYQFIGTEADDRAGVSVASAGDVDGDGLADLIIGADQADGGDFGSGEAYLATSADLAAADAADGVTDGVIDLDNLAAQSTSYQFIGTEVSDRAGISVASAGDVDGDGKADLIIGAQYADGGGGNSGEAYLATSADLAAADAADGVTDGVIDLDNLAAQSTSYQFIGTEVSDRAGISVASAGDVDGDGKADLIIGASGADGGGSNSGEAYLLYGADLAAADARDGTVDGVIDLDNANCFAAGTLIATPSGEVAVEALGPGDMVLTADGCSVPVRFNLYQAVPMHRLRVPEKFTPVRICAGALGAGVPHSDLVVTADHGMIVDGLVVNASALVNGRSIDWVPMAELPDQVTFYHVETEAHDVILANGAPAETFVDTAGRMAFDNYAEYLELYRVERIVPEMARPRVSFARLLPEAIKARLGIFEDAVSFEGLRIA